MEVRAKPFLTSLQGLRFVAALMVLIYHVDLELKHQTFPTTYPFRDETGVFWAVGVDIFFIVSGFIMYFLSANEFGKEGYVKSFLERRLIRVVPLYWLFTTLFLATMLFTPALLRHADTSVGRVVTSYLFIPWPRAGGGIFPILGLGWTLNYEMFFYALFALGLLLPRRAGLSLIMGGLALLALLGPLVPDELFVLKFWSRPIVLEFALGMLLAMAYLAGVRLGGFFRCTLFVLGATLLVLFGRADFHAPLWRPIWAGLPCALIAAGTLLGTDFDGETRFGKALVVLGSSSYSLYLTHMFATRALTLIWTKLHLEGGWVYFVAAVVSCLALAVATYYLIEQPLLAACRRPLRLQRVAGTIETTKA